MISRVDRTAARLPSVPGRLWFPLQRDAEFPGGSFEKEAVHPVDRHALVMNEDANAETVSQGHEACRHVIGRGTGCEFSALDALLDNRPDLPCPAFPEFRTQNGKLRVPVAQGEKLEPQRVDGLEGFPCQHAAKALDILPGCAAVLQDEGVGVEVIDLRCVVPLDVTTVTESVAKTGRLLVVDEDYLSFGLSGELVKRVVENLGSSAIKGVSRLGNPDLPIPAALSLEREVIPNEDRILSAARAIIGSG